MADRDEQIKALVNALQGMSLEQMMQNRAGMLNQGGMEGAGPGGIGGGSGGGPGMSPQYRSDAPLVIGSVRG